MATKNLTPVLRFPEFKENWKKKKFKQIYSFKATNSYSREKLNYEKGIVKNIHYGDIHTKFDSLFDITTEKVPYINKEVNISKINQDSFLKEGDLVIADASEDYKDIGKSIEVINLGDEKVVAGLHTFLARKESNDVINGFASFLMKIQNVRLQVMRIAQGTKVLSISPSRLAEISFFIPSIQEQEKLTSFLIKVNERIDLLKKKKEALEEYKNGIIQKLFSQEIRFKDKKGNKFPDWEEKKLGDLLSYLQPTNFLVSSTEYNDKYTTPVLTAGKTFILGYTNEKTGIFKDKLPTIIFDDFTTAFKFVDFPFKAKSSAMKMLIPKNSDVNIRYVFEAMKTIQFPVSEHKRYWISEYQNQSIPYPSLSEQQKIVSFLSSLNQSIEHTQDKRDKTILFKQGLLQKMFV